MQDDLTPEEVAAHKAALDKMTVHDLVFTQRYAAIGSPIFCNEEVYKHFKARLKLLGGITPEVSKAVGWEGGR